MPRLGNSGATTIGGTEVNHPGLTAQLGTSQLKLVSPECDMVPIPSGQFAMGSDRHYPEEAPVHWVKVALFQIDRTPVTNAQFRGFVEATGYVTVAEIPPDPKDYPGAQAHMLRPGSLVFTPPGHVDNLRDWSQWWRFEFGADWRHPLGRRLAAKGGGRPSGCAYRVP
jgi:formylglycine-generating enzyme